LRAHFAKKSVKEIFGGDGKVFLCFLPPNFTDALQPIDAAYGRALRCAICRLLDQWLMDDENMESLEKKYVSCSNEGCSNEHSCS